jgi:hypothetical protein
VAAGAQSLARADHPDGGIVVPASGTQLPPDGCGGDSLMCVVPHVPSESVVHVVVTGWLLVPQGIVQLGSPK